ncbi:hypothetical protein K469DRAFT_707836 [Zopfia rhizophila CBS 207.26]|uniref:Uncharacterized protein n=1 Tax=Zopfia rhizophila CBS 207.26 TaxID=1314779 RepID=A0A6A6E0X8_9PEZI|nr:hypothetical protein K469DRAFT_707836 [Zopfia rhizophila CBS 207.26]
MRASARNRAAARQMRVPAEHLCALAVCGLIETCFFGITHAYALYAAGPVNNSAQIVLGETCATTAIGWDSETQGVVSSRATGSQTSASTRFRKLHHR